MANPLLRLMGRPDGEVDDGNERTCVRLAERDEPSKGVELTEFTVDGVQLPTRPRSRSRRRERLMQAVPFLGYLAAQSFIVAGLVTPRFTDSAGYLNLSFTGQDTRLWTVPLLYTIFPSDPLRIAAQVILAGCAWWVLALVASRLVEEPRVRLGLRIVLLALGLVGPIASWNSTILSDSVAISLTVLLIGCWLLRQHHPTWPTTAVVLVVTLFWTFTRNDLVIVGVWITVLFLVWTIWRHRSWMNFILAVGLVLISAYGLEINGRNPYVSDANIADIIEGRVLPNPDWTIWWLQHGMPDSAAIQATENGTFGHALMTMPAFQAWLTADGTRTYYEFMVSHPVYTLYDPLPDFSGELASLLVPNRTPYVYTQPNPSPSMLSPDANYGRHRDILPSVIEELLFEQGQIGDVTLLAFCAFGLAYVARRRYGRDPRMGLVMIIALSAIPQGFLVWLGGGDGETDRHAIVLAVTLRVGLWIVAGLALDRILRSRRAELVGPSTT